MVSTHSLPMHYKCSCAYISGPLPKTICAVLHVSSCLKQTDIQNSSRTCFVALFYDTPIHFP